MSSVFSIKWIFIQLILLLHFNILYASEVISGDAVSCDRSMTWKSKNGSIYLNNKQFNIKGANWFGFETEINVLHGLWGSTTMDKVLDFCKKNKINSLRIPISLELALDNTAIVQRGSCVECKGVKAWDMLNALFDKSAERGILILLDMHRLNKYQQSELWYDSSYSEEHFMRGWVNLLRTFGNKNNLLGIDLKNEPYGAATWGKNSVQTDWNAAATRIVNVIIDKVPSFNKLIFIEGVGTGGADPLYSISDPSYSKFWGMNLDGVKNHPIIFDKEDVNDRIVYSPHVYGPSVAHQSYFSAGNFPDNMVEIWDKQIGFVEKLTGKALVIGEWGGRYTGSDKLWQDAFADYMARKCLGDNFVWCINPNSGDTGGLLKDDWTTPDNGKLNIMAMIQPYPSQFSTSLNSELICVAHGRPAYQSCMVNDIVDISKHGPTIEGNTQPSPLNGKCVEDWGNCSNDGICCSDTFQCEKKNDWYKQCTLKPLSPTSTPIAQSSAMSPAVSGPSTHDSVHPSNELECSAGLSQCGGKNWAGASCCISGFSCAYINEYFSQCLEINDKSNVTDSTVDDVYTSGNYVPMWGQCGGLKYTGSTLCISGSICESHGIWYSQCIPVESETGECNGHWSQCDGVDFVGSHCCVSNWKCKYVNDWYSQCVPSV